MSIAITDPSRSLDTNAMSSTRMIPRSARSTISGITSPVTGWSPDHSMTM